MLPREKCEVIKKAIQSKNKLSFSYKGHQRIADPHMLGTTDNGYQFYSWQSGGASSSGTIPCHRKFHVGSIRDLNVLNDKFEVCEQYDPEKEKENFNTVLEEVE